MSSYAVKLEKVRSLVASGQYAVLADQLSSRFLPAGNPVAYWDRFVLVALSQPRALRRPPGTVPIRASASDIESLCALDPGRAHQFRRRAESGQTCYVIKEEGTIVARMWVIGEQDRYVTNSGLWFVPPSRPNVWCHDVWVDPAMRLRGHFVALMRHVWQSGDFGKNPTLYGEIHHLNEGSIRAHRTLGFDVIGDVMVVSALGLKLYLSKDKNGRRTLDWRYALSVPHN